MTSTEWGNTLVEVVGSDSVAALAFAPPSLLKRARANFLAVPIRKTMSSPLSSTAVAARRERSLRTVIGSRLYGRGENLRTDAISAAPLPPRRSTQSLARNWISGRFLWRSEPRLKSRNTVHG